MMDSDDETTAIIRRVLSLHLVAMRELPYRRIHDLEGILREKMALIESSQDRFG